MAILAKTAESEENLINYAKERQKQAKPRRNSKRVSGKLFPKPKIPPKCKGSICDFRLVNAFVFLSIQLSISIEMKMIISLPRSLLMVSASENGGKRFEAFLVSGRDIG